MTSLYPYGRAGLAESKLKFGYPNALGIEEQFAGKMLPAAGGGFVGTSECDEPPPSSGKRAPEAPFDTLLGDEAEDVLVDDVRVCGRHAVREALVNLEGGVLQELS